MSISSVTSKVIYTGTGSTAAAAKVFAYPFKVFRAADLTVSDYDIASSVATVKVLDTDYAVSGVGVDGGGNVTLTGSYTNLPTSSQLVIQRIVDLTQETDYVENDAFPAETHEQALDRLTMIDQQQQEELDRCIKANIAQTSSGAGYVEIIGIAKAAADSSAAVAVAQASNAVVSASSASDSATQASSSQVACASSSAVAVAQAAITVSSATVAVAQADVSTSSATVAVDNGLICISSATVAVDSADASASSATVSVSVTDASTSSAAVSVTQASNAAVYAAQASSSAASVSSGVLGNLSNLTAPVEINEPLLPGSSNYISLGSAAKEWDGIYASGTGNIVTVVSTLVSTANLNVPTVSASTLNISGTSSTITLRSTLLTSATARVSGTANITTVVGTLLSANTLDIAGTANITTLKGTLLSANTLDVSGTGSITTVRSTLLSAATLNISGTANATTVTATLVSSSSMNVSGTMNATNVKGDGSLLTGLSSVTQENDTDAGTNINTDNETTILSKAKTITNGKTVMLIASGTYKYSAGSSGTLTIKLKQGSTAVHTLTDLVVFSSGSGPIIWSACAIVTGLSGEITFSVTGQRTDVTTWMDGNLIILEF